MQQVHQSLFTSAFACVGGPDQSCWLCYGSVKEDGVKETSRLTVGNWWWNRRWAQFRRSGPWLETTIILMHKQYTVAYLLIPSRLTAPLLIFDLDAFSINTAKAFRNLTNNQCQKYKSVNEIQADCVCAMWVAPSGNANCSACVCVWLRAYTVKSKCYMDIIKTGIKQ